MGMGRPVAERAGLRAAGPRQKSAATGARLAAVVGHLCGIRDHPRALPKAALCEGVRLLGPIAYATLHVRLQVLMPSVSDECASRARR